MDHDRDCPTVSVIIPCYKQAHFLPVALTSVFSQESVRVEPIVIDDGSPDDVTSAIAPFGDRVQYVRQSNMGLAGARNSGLCRATSEFVVFLDADDWFLPGSLANRVEALRQHPDAAGCISSWQEFARDGVTLLHRRDPPRLLDDQFHQLLKGNIAPPICFALRRRVLDRIGFFTRQTPGVEDWDLWLRLAGHGYKFVYAPESHGAYRVHEGSMSSNTPRMYDAALTVLRRHRAWHGDCRRCNASTRYALKALWVQYGAFLVSRFRNDWRAGWSSLAGAMLRTMDEPGLPGAIVSGYLREMARRKFGSGVRRPQGS